MSYDLDAMRKKVNALKSGRRSDPDEFRPAKADAGKELSTVSISFRPTKKMIRCVEPRLPIAWIRSSCLMVFTSVFASRHSHALGFAMAAHVQCVNTASIS
jgi:hypothetical protein